MGWLWSSKESRDDVESSPSTESSPQSSVPHSFPPTDKAATKTAVNRDAAANAELVEFLKSIQDEDEATSQAPALVLPKARSQPTIPYSVPESTPTSAAITPTTIHPTTMSCRSAFDLAFYCQSLGGQFNSIYRQGSVRNCGQLWGDFWFCMRTNRGWMSDKEREERILAHFQKRERKYVDGPSSEDIWKARETMVVGAFEEDFEAVESIEMLVKRENSAKGFDSNGNRTGDSEM